MKYSHAQAVSFTSMNQPLINFRLSYSGRKGGNCAVFACNRAQFRESLASAFIDLKARAPLAKLKLETSESANAPRWVSVYALDETPTSHLMEPVRWECAGDLYDRAAKIHSPQAAEDPDDTVHSGHRSETDYA